MTATTGLPCAVLCSKQGGFAVCFWFLSKQSSRYGLSTSIYLGNGPGAAVWVWRQERRKGKNPVKSLLIRGLSLWVISSNRQRNLLETHCRCSEMFLNIIWNFLGIYDDYGHDRTGRKSNISGRIKKGTIPRIFWI